ncbi:MAG: M48 family metalloprotease [Thermoplasmatales archaeon]|nr:MAG: M48 family metalloprotease [Thermoplasmatales archaeon]
MNGIECFIYCIQETGLLYPIIGLITLTLIFLFIFSQLRNNESLLASQITMTIIISFNLLSMNCDMFYWLWIYIGIILIGTILMGIVRIYLDLKLDENFYRLPPLLSDLEKQWKVEIRIIDTQKIKAFTYKNRIYLSIGLIERLEKDEIQSVVAHEVYHLRHSSNKFLSSILALTSMTFLRFNDQHLADKYAVKKTGFKNLVNAFKKLQIKDAEKRIKKLSSLILD